MNVFKQRNLHLCLFCFWCVMLVMVLVAKNPSNWPWLDILWTTGCAVGIVNELAQFIRSSHNSKSDDVK